MYNGIDSTGLGALLTQGANLPNFVFGEPSNTNIPPGGYSQGGNPIKPGTGPYVPPVLAPAGPGKLTLPPGGYSQGPNPIKPGTGPYVPPGAPGKPPLGNIPPGGYSTGPNPIKPGTGPYVPPGIPGKPTGPIKGGLPQKQQAILGAPPRPSGSTIYPSQVPNDIPRPIPGGTPIGAPIGAPTPTLVGQPPSSRPGAGALPGQGPLGANTPDYLQSLQAQIAANSSPPLPLFGPGSAPANPLPTGNTVGAPAAPGAEDPATMQILNDLLGAIIAGNQQEFAQGQLYGAPPGTPPHVAFILSQLGAR